MRCTFVAQREFASIQTTRETVEFTSYRGVGLDIVVLDKGYGGLAAAASLVGVEGDQCGLSRIPAEVGRRGE